MTDEQILNLLGFDDASDEMRERVLENTRSIVEMRVIGLITEMMTDKQETEFETIRQTGDSEAVWDWLEKQVVGVNVRELYEATLKDYITDYKQNEFKPDF